MMMQYVVLLALYGQIYIGWSRQVELTASEGTMRYRMYRDDCGQGLILDSMVVPGSSGSLQMVDHTLINGPLANVYLDSPYYKGHCKVMCVSSPPPHIPCDNW